MTHDTAESPSSLRVDDTARTGLVIVLGLGVVIQGVLPFLVCEYGELERLHLDKMLEAMTEAETS